MKKLFLLSLLLIVNPSFGYYNSDIPNACGNYPVFYGVYTPISYNCSSGQFLPANTTGCVACPSGYTCSGGTYAFNEKESQGLVKNNSLRTQNESNTCASNFPKTLNAIYTPNTINITWQNENGTTITTNSCTYGNAITIPTAPHKTGYKFTGWSVVSQ